jgi:hypothetical protein
MSDEILSPDDIQGRLNHFSSPQLVDELVVLVTALTNLHCKGGRLNAFSRTEQLQIEWNRRVINEIKTRLKSELGE